MEMNNEPKETEAEKSIHSNGNSQEGNKFKEPGIIERASIERERLEKAIAESKVENDRRERLLAEDKLGGVTSGRPAEIAKRELTPQEYSKEVLAGRVPPKS
jgi:hypothetical protein